MATDPRFSAAELFDLLNQNASSTRASGMRASDPGLPKGSCNFVDVVALSLGASAMACGCRRFWPGPAPAPDGASSSPADSSGYCMCRHHACYHDEGGEAGRETGREASRETTGQAAARDSATPLRASDGGVSNNMNPFGLSNMPEAATPQLNSANSATQVNTVNTVNNIPDTLPWPEYVSPSTAFNLNCSLPPIPPQCLMTTTSQATSTTSSMRAKYMRPFGGIGLNTLARSNRPTLPESAPNPNPDDDRPGTGSTQIEPRALADMVTTHAQRLERIENNRLSCANHEEFLDRHDQIDLRVAELESKIEELEQCALYNSSEGTVDHDNNNINNRQDEPTSTSSFRSVDSVVTSRPSYAQRITAEIEALKEQVAQLHTMVPSRNHVWEVEVVFLPFGLKWLWRDARQLKQPSLGPGPADEWLSQSTSTTHLRPRSMSPAPGAWTLQEQQHEQDHDYERLFARAVGERSGTELRLRSRGLVQTVSIRGPDARSVQDAIYAAFQPVFRDMRLHPRSELDLDPRLAWCMGLQSAWVPLRKVYRENRLRFLNPAEMVTPTLWDVQFLSSVIMKGATRRLFITHPDGYLQDARAHETRWSWRRLKEEAPPVGLDIMESQQSTSQVDELEECWVWNEQLDAASEAPMTEGPQNQDMRPSLEMEVSRRMSISPPPMAAFPPLHVDSWTAAAAAAAAAATTSTTSTTTAYQHYASASSSFRKPKRESSSSSRQTTPTPTRIAPLHGVLKGGIVKRRRERSLSHGPSHRRFTPSRTSSPTTSPVPANLSERQAGYSVGVVVPPYAYNTPHSNVQEMRLRAESVLRAEMELMTTQDDDDDDDDDMHDINDKATEAMSSSDDDDDEDDGDEDEDGDMQDMQDAQAQQNSQVIHPLFAAFPDEEWPSSQESVRLVKRRKSLETETQQKRKVMGMGDSQASSSQPSEHVILHQPPADMRAQMEDSY